tara:strand:+ start:1990 stop:2274 length:285 start_codon:yes stop_codon:yes gene_type:complete
MAKKYKMVNGERLEMTAEEITQLEKMQADADLDFTMVRADRNGKLFSTDWTQLSDAPITEAKKTEWAAYRQELRDYPSKASKVSELPAWPSEPT